MLLPRRFPDRKAAGKALAERLVETVESPAMVLGIPNGGLIVARPIARALRAPLGAAWVSRVVRPREPDVVLGAVDVDGDVTVNPEAANAEGLDNELVTELAFHTHERLRLRAGAAAQARLDGQTVIIVDDGLTTGMTLIAALHWARRHGAARRLVAVPVVDRLIWQHVAAHADEAIALEEREDGPIARSDVYEDFRRVPPSTISRILRGLRTAAHV